LKLAHPVPLFGLRLTGPVEADIWYMVSSDSQRFLVNTVTEEATPITVILNLKPRP
jgi:hypothetical protein